MKIITLCGSKRNKVDIYDKALELRNIYGCLVFTPMFINRKPTNDEMELLKQNHFDKIRISTDIFVIGDYGEDTQKEIDFARKLNKNIFIV